MRRSLGGPGRRKPLIARDSPGRDGKVYEERVAPDGLGRRISEGHEMGVDELQQMRNGRRQLKTAHPQRPESLRAQGDGDERAKYYEVDDQDPDLDLRKAEPREEKQARKRRCEAHRRGNALVATPTQPGIAAGRDQQAIIENEAGEQHDGRPDTGAGARSISFASG